ncbi:MAG TPA: hypothetical protein VHY37_03465 [Tepidisphaeraceae bacterium]|jgi:hypothetical protein|nr:hypothetical protein [Tepidisphaeraceae bacterium]
MRRLLLILGGLLMVGCAAQTPPLAPPTPPSLAQFTSASAAAPSLSFNPPVMPPYPLPGLDRASRERSAFFGYIDPTTEYYFISTYDEVGGGYCPWDDGYDRLAVTAQAGAVTR